jgi:hypothetical protein
MAAALTLHHGDQQANYVEHPMEVARKALLAAADLEAGEWSFACRGIAELLPDRPAIMKGET